RGAFTCPLVDPLARPLGRLASPNPVPQNFLHGRLSLAGPFVLGRPAADVGAAVQENFQPDPPGRPHSAALRSAQAQRPYPLAASRTPLPLPPHHERS